MALRHFVEQKGLNDEERFVNLSGRSRQLIEVPVDLCNCLSFNRRKLKKVKAVKID
jgi:hypothetical protein